ncbi:MAG TPA: PRC-barrel domain-containing protein, partial [Rhodanobacter sp.]|nr:PRC-barrel domain-containing protein [Rhodanobacter sp.]
MNDLESYVIRATDGDLGHVKDFYFDDQAWVIRYLVVDTGNWLSNRKVLISPIAVDRPDWGGKVLPVSITKEQVRNSPGIDTDKPVSRQHEIDHLGYFGYPYYWGGSGLWGMGAHPSSMRTMVHDRQGTGRREPHGGAGLGHGLDRDDPHLRSCQEILGYRIEATDGDIGRVQGLLVEEDTWAIRYIVVETSHWWSGHLVLIVPEWIRHVSWAENTVAVNLRRQAVKGAPPYDSAA